MTSSTMNFDKDSTQLSYDIFNHPSKLNINHKVKPLWNLHKIEMEIQKDQLAFIYALEKVKDEYAVRDKTSSKPKNKKNSNEYSLKDSFDENTTEKKQGELIQKEKKRRGRPRKITSSNEKTFNIRDYITH